MTKTDLEKIVSFMQESEKDEFFGEITFKFKNGKIYAITKTATFRPEDL
jgi:hypothetical protein